MVAVRRKHRSAVHAAWVLGVLFASSVGVGCGGGQAVSDGPLQGPRVEAGGVEVCAPAGSERDVYFGEVFTNGAETDVTIRSIVAERATNVGEVVMSIDLEGPALGETVGAVWYPSPSGEDDLDHIIERGVDPSGAVVPPGAAISVLMSPRPSDAGNDAVLGATLVTYEVDGREMKELNEVRYLVVPAESCH